MIYFRGINKSFGKIFQIQELQFENDRLKKQLENKESLCLMASTKVKSNADYLAREIDRSDDLIILAIDGLQQVTSFFLNSKS